MKFYTCPMCCNAGFTNQQELKEHLQKASNPVDCPACLKSCKNVIYLIKHLDQCAASKSEDDQPCYNRSSNNLNDRGQNSLVDDDDDDVEGYFCTVCDIKIPDVYKHIQQFHSGQEVILQDDDDDEVETLNQPSFYNNSDKTDKSGGHDQKSNSSPTKREYKRKSSDEYNGKDIKEENHKNKKMKKKFKDEDLGEALYCVKCDISFSSLSDHMKNYHSNFKFVVQDLSITELLPESKTSNGSLAYNCSCCRKSFVRKTTLVKHLKLNVYKDTKSRSRKTCCRRKAAEEKFDDSANQSATNSGTDYENDNDAEEIVTKDESEVKIEPEEEEEDDDDDEFEAATPVQNEATFPLEGINHIFNT